MKMNILVTVNDRYVRPLLVMMDSLFQHQDGNRIRIYLMYSDVCSKNREKLREKAETHGAGFTEMFIEKDLFREYPAFRYFSQEMYYRLLCGKYLPEKEQRVLYLDPDILVENSLAELYQTDLEGKSIGAVEDYAVNHMLVSCKKRIGLPENVPYVNSGVILFDLDRMRRLFSAERMFSILEEKREVLSFPDQDLINLYFQGDIHYMDRGCNYNCGYGDVGAMLRYFFSKKQKKELPTIIHFMGASKPWMVSYYGKFGERYYQFLKPYLEGREKWQFSVRYLYKANALLHTAVKILRGRGEKWER